jgi:hypothetical protein
MRGDQKRDRTKKHWVIVRRWKKRDGCGSIFASKVATKKPSYFSTKKVMNSV